MPPFSIGPGCITLASSFRLINQKIMTTNNENRSPNGDRKKSSTQAARKGSGQQTAGERGQKNEKENERTLQEQRSKNPERKPWR